jgi:SNF2 family DNA or RNA helicase
VHRIGQTRGVHVLKLVTEGTLEEKIAAIIARKRKLMESVVHEDDQGSLEVLDRDELAALMSFDLEATMVQRGDDPTSE